AINWATLIAWSALLAMFPILLVGASIVGISLSVAGVSEKDVVKSVGGAIGDAGVRAIVEQALTSFKHQSGVFAIVGFVGLMFGGSALFGSMEQGFAIIYHTSPRSFVPQKLLGMAMIVPFSILVGLAIGSSAALAALAHLSFVPTFLSQGPAALLIQIAFGALTGFMLFALIYFVVPNRRQQWSKVWPGAMLAGVLFEAVVLLFPLYLEVNKGIQNYGKTPALFLTLMTFFFFLGIVTMVGVELNSVLFPVPVEQPGEAEALAPRHSGPEGEKQVVGGAGSAYPRQATNPQGRRPPGPPVEGSGASQADDGVVVLTPEMAEEANAGIAGLAAAQARVGKARTLVGVGALAWAFGVVVGQRTRKGRA
ncbi:MAG TPA: YihY/virulence factor BrkB family protein, partial [Candidatus Dormibacteraeota bacterium]|nr:YihY/virulence factor BrkB family protein [Candidatus Dormibacteraeota bacterium]